MSGRGLLAGLITVLFVGGGWAADVKTNAKKDNPGAETPKFKVVAYPVADLIVPVDMEPCAPKTGAHGRSQLAA